MTYPVVRPLYMPPRRPARRPFPLWLRRAVFSVSLVLAVVAGVAFSRWIGSVSESPDGTEAVTSDGGEPRVTPMTSRPSPSTTELPTETTASPSATTTPPPPSAETLRPVP